MPVAPASATPLERFERLADLTLGDGPKPPGMPKSLAAARTEHLRDAVDQLGGQLPGLTKGAALIHLGDYAAAGPEERNAVLRLLDRLRTTCAKLSWPQPHEPGRR